MSGVKIRKMREERGLSRRTVSIATGITEMSLFNLETGKNTNPTLKTLLALAGFYGVSVEELLLLLAPAGAGAFVELVDDED